MAIKLTLSSDSIRYKKFPSAARGYDALIVDQFLDLVINDYEFVEANTLLLNKEVEELHNKIETLTKEKQALEIENAKYKARLKGIKESDNVTTDNIKLIKRINALETFLYREGYNPNLIK